MFGGNSPGAIPPPAFKYVWVSAQTYYFGVKMQAGNKTELFDSQGRRIYFYEIYGYEHSVMYMSHIKVSKTELDELVKRSKLAQKRAREFQQQFDSRPDIEVLWERMAKGDETACQEYEAILKIEGVDNKAEEIQGNPLSQQLEDRFCMVQIEPEAKSFEDIHL